MKNNVKKKILNSIILIVILFFLGLIFTTKNKKIIIPATDKKSIALKNIISDDEEKIIFTDANLYNAIIEQIKENVQFENNDTDYSITITNAEKEKIKELCLNNKNISNISGIEFFTFLTNLNINNNNITDISMLNNLINLKELKACGNTIKEISTLSNLTELEYLNLSKNKLEDNDNNLKATVSNMKQLINLTHLDLSHNYLKYTEDLQELINLKYLNLYDNAIEDLRGISNLYNLEILNLGQNNETGKKTISNLDSLKNLTNLKYLDFSENNMPSIIDNISELENLETLSLQKNKISDKDELNASILSNLEKITKLKTLNLYDNSIMRMASIKSLTKLTNLEELILGKNDIRIITPIYSENGELAWHNMRKLDLSGNIFIYTPYSTEINNITRLEENNNIIQRLKETNIELNYEYITDTFNLPHTDENGIKYVTYEDFGAKCDGIYDDFIAIRNAHLFANLNNCEVKATNGKKYHIFKEYEEGVIVKTNVDWCNATLIIHDENIEEKSGRFLNLFIIKNISDKEIILEPNWTILKTDTNIKEKIKSQLEKLNENGYKKYLCIATNSTKKQYIRYGANENSGDNQQDYFLIDDKGNVLNDIQWDFEKITSFTIYAIPNSKINIKNGVLISNNLNSEGELTYTRLGTGKSMYIARNIFINESANITISGIKHITPKDTLSGSYQGIIYAKIGTNINISDCELYSRKYSIEGRSTYDLNLYGIINSNYNNITSNSIFDNKRWGIVATYFSKDIVFEKCYINRIDAHQGIYNLTVKDCQIGCHGLTMTGQGTLNVINTEITAPHFINLRDDYGSTWNGDVNIVDCTYRHIDTSIPKLCSFMIRYDGNNIHDFGYECKYPNLYVENLTIDNCNNTKYNYVLLIPNYISQKPENVPASYWPDKIFINGYKFINNVLPNPYIRLTDNNKGNINGNYVITDTKIKVNSSNGNEITNQFKLNDDVQVNEDVYIEINENSSAENRITLYKDDEIIEKNKLIENKYNYSFNEEGNYKIKLDSIEKIYNRTGEEIYEFKIDKTAPQIQGVENGNAYEKINLLVVDENLSEIKLEKDGEIQKEYKNGDEINNIGNYVITATDKAGNKTIKSFTIRVLKIEFEDYKECNKNGKKYIENIEPKTLHGVFINNIKTNGEMHIFKDNIEITNNATKITTGMKVKIILNNETIEYVIVVKGDTNGDGECNLKDILQVNKHRLNKAQLEGEYFLAGDVNSDTEVNIKDLLKMNKYRLGKIESL